MFGSLINKAVMAVTPTLAVSLFGGLSWEQILTLGTAAAAGTVSISLPGVIDLWKTKRQNERSGLGFLLKFK